MKWHVAGVHEGKKPFQCPHCSSSFSEKGNWKGHIASVHEGKKRCKCPYCDVKYAHLVTLRKHILEVHGLDATNLKQSDCKDQEIYHENSQYDKRDLNNTSNTIGES